MSFRNTDTVDSDQNDLFEEFEFKPLSSGLGFHKKTEPLPSETNAGAQRNQTQQASSFDLKMPLPRKNESKDSGKDSKKSKKNSASNSNSTSASETNLGSLSNSHEISNSPLIENLKGVLSEKTIHRIKSERPWEIEELNEAQLAAKGIAIQEGSEWKKTSFDLTALLMDSFIIGAIYLLTLVVFVGVTEIDLIKVINHGVADESIVYAMLALAVTVAWIYMVACRLITGVTAGEFVFDQRLGLISDFKKGSYGWKVALRTTLLFATGFVFFPLIEEIFRKDLLGSMFGITHYRKVILGSRS